MPHKKSEDGWLSVTEVLSLVIDKPFLRYWFGKHGTEVCEQIKRESQELGIEVHSLIENQFKEITWVDTEDIQNSHRMVSNFWAKFVIPYEVKPIQLEVTCKDDKLKLQGTFDAIIETNKGDYVADWKTSNQLDKITVPLQLAAYAHLSGQGLWRGLAVRIDKEKDKIEVKEYEDLAPYWPIFLQCLSVAKYIKFGLEVKE